MMGEKWTVEELQTLPDEELARIIWPNLDEETRRRAFTVLVKVREDLAQRDERIRWLEDEVRRLSAIVLDREKQP